MLPVRTILHPTDFSAYAENAFALACSLARDYQARLLVLHVLAPPEEAEEGMEILPYPESYRKDLLERLAQLYAPDADVRVEDRVVEGHAATAILEAAAREQCDLIVMGTHGRSGLGRLLMGSVAEEVVRKAPCPVLTVKMPVGRPGQAVEVHQPLTSSGV